MQTREVGERTDLPLLRLMAADQLVAFNNLQRRMKRAELTGQSPDKFWAARTNLLDRMPYFHRFRIAARPYVPEPMFEQWGRQLALVPWQSETG